MPILDAAPWPSGPSDPQPMTTEPVAAPGALQTSTSAPGGGLPAFLGAVIAFFLRLRHMTWRKDMRELAKIDALFDRGEKVMAVFWHGNYIPLFSLLSGRKACVFASDSFRGRIIAAMDDVVAARIRLEGEQATRDPSALFAVVERARGRRLAARHALE